MSTALITSQLVAAPSKMDNETFRLHMTHRHADSLPNGGISDANFTPDVAEPYRAFHRRLHDLRTDIPHHHSPEPPEAAVEFALYCMRENRLRGWRQIAGTQGVVAFCDDGSFAVRFGTHRPHYLNKIEQVAEVLLQGKFPR